jgi:hypothetical protein
MRVCVQPGNVAWDDCCKGQLTLTVEGLFPSSTFPLPDITSIACQAGLIGVSMKVLLLRCAPGPDGRGNPPTCEQLDAAARTNLEDMLAVWLGVSCCLADMQPEVDGIMRAQTPLGPDGACMGSETLFTLGFLNECGC